MDCSFFSELLVTLTGGILLALIFFFFKEIVFPIPNISGVWHFEMRTEKTDYAPYADMVLRYEAVLWQEGKKIKGSSEKSYENSSEGTRRYVGKDRIRGVIEGCVDKNYLSKDKIVFHIIEKGQERESTHYFEIHFKSKNKMSGKFDSTIAGQSGKVTWQRDSFQN